MFVANLALMLASVSSAEFSLVVEPPAVVLGDVTEVNLVLRGPGVRPEDFVMRVEEGEIREVNTPSINEVRARWVLPTNLMPRRLAAAAIDSRTQHCKTALLAISRRARLKVAASPHADVRLRVAGELVASGKADAKGQLTMSVPVPPAVDPASVEQEVEGLSDAALKFQELGVRNAIHAWLVSAAEIFPDGKTRAPIFLALYRDDGSRPDEAEVAVATDEPRVAAAVEEIAPGLWRADIVAGPYAGGTPDQLQVMALARMPHGEAGAHLGLRVVNRLPARLELVLPPVPWRVAEVYDVVAAVYDEGGGIMPEATIEARIESSGVATTGFTVIASGRDPGGSQHLLVRTPSIVPKSEVTLAVAVGGSGPRARSPILVEPGPVAALVLDGPSVGTGAVEFELTAYDRYGNPVPGLTPELHATGGELKPVASRAGTMRFGWRPLDRRRSELVRLEAVLPESGGRAVTAFHYRAQVSRFKAGVLAGLVSDASVFTAPAVILHLDYTEPLVHEDLSLGIVLAGARVSRSQPTQIGRQDAVVDRTSYLLPVTASAQWRVLPGESWSVRVGAGVGVLASGVGVRLLAGGEEIMPTQWRWAVGPIGQLSMRLGYELGPGEVSFLVRGWDVISGDMNFSKRPRAVEAALGYTLAVAAGP
jgi:hypothetical protein